MALRVVAEHVDRDLREIMCGAKNSGPMEKRRPITGRCQCQSVPERLIRYTRRLASSMEASWIVANIEGPRPLSQEEQTRLHSVHARWRASSERKSFLPGAVTLLKRCSVSRARTTSHKSSSGNRSGRAGSVLKRDPLSWLMRHSGNIDIHMIPTEESAQPRREGLEELLARTPWEEFGIALGIAAVVTAFSLSVVNYIGYWAIALFLFVRSGPRRNASASMADVFSRGA